MKHLELSNINSSYVKVDLRFGRDVKSDQKEQLSNGYTEAVVGAVVDESFVYRDMTLTFIAMTAYANYGVSHPGATDSWRGSSCRQENCAPRYESHWV